MYLTPNKAAILRELRHGPLSLPVIAQAADLPPFTTRAELKDLKRARLVSDHFRHGRHEWELTVTGCGVGWSSEQLELEGRWAW